MSLLRIAALATTTFRVTARAARQMRGMADGPERWRAAAEHQRRGAREALLASGITVQQVGALPNRAALLVANHASLLDGWVLAAALPFAIIGKAEVMDWPGVGFVARTYELLPVDRERRTTTGSFVERVQARIEAGVSVLVFAEGTTSQGEALLPFKTGAFEAVAGTGVPVVPIFQSVEVSASGPVTDRRPFAWFEEPLWTTLRRFYRLRPRVAVVRIGAPIATEGETRKTLAAKTRAGVAALDPLGRSA